MANRRPHSRRPQPPGHHYRTQELHAGDRLQLHPLSSRRPLPPGLQRSPARRTPAHRHRLLAAGERLLRRPRHHRRTRPDRQRRLLQVQALHPDPHDGGIVHKKIRPYRPQTNGKVERFNRTLLDEWAYQRPYTSNTERTEALADFLHIYNHHRCHTALDGHPPISRVNNAAGQYSYAVPGVAGQAGLRGRLPRPGACGARATSATWPGRSPGGRAPGQRARSRGARTACGCGRCSPPGRRAASRGRSGRGPTR